MKEKKLVFVTSSLFPDGQAYSTRVTNFARLFSHIGFSVHIIANKMPIAEYKENVIYMMENFTFEIAGENSRKANLFSNKKNAFQALERYAENNHVDYIIFNGSAYGYFFRLKQFCCKNNIVLLTELCEWYDYSNFKLKIVDPRYIRANQYMKNIYTKQDNFIVISRLLEGYYSKNSVNVLRVPTILDVKNSECNYYTRSNDKVRIMYAGNLGKSKELLLNILIAIKKLKKMDSDIANKLQFDIYGVNEVQILVNIKGNNELFKELSDIISIKGKVKQQEMHSVYQLYDFSIFIRPTRLSSDAGFPTKLAESMMAGTPVITNNTGDVGLYIKSGKNGFLVNNSSETIGNLFQKLFFMTPEEKLEISRKARETAEEIFDYRYYIKDIKKFLLKAYERTHL